MLSDFKKKRKADHRPVKKIFMALGGIFMIGLCLVLVMADIKMYKKRQQLNEQLATLQTKVKEIETRNEKIKVSEDQMDNSDYLERVAREEFNLKKPGEKVVSFILPEGSGQPQNAAPKTGFAAWTAGIGNAFNWVKENF